MSGVEKHLDPASVSMVLSIVGSGKNSFVTSFSVCSMHSNYGIHSSGQARRATTKGFLTP
jgi:hypothetical protein